MRSVTAAIFCALLLVTACDLHPILAQEPDIENMENAGDDLEEYERRPQSRLMWTINALGWKYSLALPLAGLAALVMTYALVKRESAAAGPALLLIVPLPMLVGVFGGMDAMMTNCQPIALTNLRADEVAECVSISLVAPMLGMLLMAPAYIVAMGGLFIRTLMGDKAAPKT